MLYIANYYATYITMYLFMTEAMAQSARGLVLLDECSASATTDS